MLALALAMLTMAVRRGGLVGDAAGMPAATSFKGSYEALVIVVMVMVMVMGNPPSIQLFIPSCADQKDLTRLFVFHPLALRGITLTRSHPDVLSGVEHACLHACMGAGAWGPEGPHLRPCGAEGPAATSSASVRGGGAGAQRSAPAA